MFDPETTRLIQSALPLDGLDPAALPEMLTEAYATVVAARMRIVRAPTLNQSADDRVREETLSLRRLADTYEGLTIFLPDGDAHRSGCAFVAGSAHHALEQAARARGTGRARPSLTSNAISSDVCAALLFLIGEHQADAAEVTREWVVTQPTATAEFLVVGVAAIASGDGREIERFLALQRATGEFADYTLAAADKLYRLLLVAIRDLASRLLGLSNADPIVGIQRVLDLVGGATMAPGPVLPGPVALPVHGPHHLARLLLPAAKALLANAAVLLPPPPNVDPDGWRAFIKSYGRRRPVLWRNHREACGGGFLNSGSSAVVTFPTGAGKTTVTELRIAATILAGLAVVVLAPTRALVDQVARELETTLAPIAPGVVRGRFLEDFGDNGGAQVYVQTPEQCLAYLAHDPDAHADVGLLVVDEFHQVSGIRASPENPRPIPGRRAVDAMLAVLEVTSRAPEADVVCISAMVANGAAASRWLSELTGRPCLLFDLRWKPTRQVRGIVAYEKSEIDALERTLSMGRVQAQRASVGRETPGPSAAVKRGLEVQPQGLFCLTQVWTAASSYTRLPLLPSKITLGANKFWSLTANRNHVAGRLLAALAFPGMRPIVFTQQVKWTRTIAKEGERELERQGVAAIALTPQEGQLLAAAARELGAVALVESPAGVRVGVHHGLLILQERLAVESAFKRRNGLRALVATPTVAQGINLPAEAVILAGDDRWEADDDGGTFQTLPPHELLNAAGRAGRAGHFAHGLVIDVPSSIFWIERRGDDEHFSGLQHAMSLLGVPDQCLDIVDPLTQVIDRLADASPPAGVPEYLVRRLGGQDSAALHAFFRRSFGAVNATDREAVAIAAGSAVATAMSALSPVDPGLAPWLDLAGRYGVPSEAVLGAANLLPSIAELEVLPFQDIVGAMLEVLTGAGALLSAFVRPDASDMARLLPLIDGETQAAWSVRVGGTVRSAARGWMAGEPIKDIGAIFHASRTGRAKPDELGRRFAIQSASAIGHGLSVLATIAQTRDTTEPSERLKAWLKLLPGCVREGFDEPDKLLFFWALRRKQGLYPRVVVHDLHGSRGGGMPTWDDRPEIDDRREVVGDILANELAR